MASMIQQCCSGLSAYLSLCSSFLRFLKAIADKGADAVAVKSWWVFDASGSDLIGDRDRVGSRGCFTGGVTGGCAGGLTGVGIGLGTLTGLGAEENLFRELCSGVDSDLSSRWNMNRKPERSDTRILPKQSGFYAKTWKTSLLLDAPLKIISASQFCWRTALLSSDYVRIYTWKQKLKSAVTFTEYHLKA